MQINSQMSVLEVALSTAKGEIGQGVSVFLGVAPWTVDTLVHAARAYGLPKHRGDEPETRIYKTNTLSHDGW